MAPHRTFLLELDVQDLEEVKPSAETTEKFRLKGKVLRLYLFNDMMMVVGNKSKKKVSDLRYKTHAMIQHVSTTNLPDFPGLNSGHFGSSPFHKVTVIDHTLCSYADLPNLLQLQLGEQRFFIQCPSPQTKNDLEDKVLKYHPVTKLLS